MAQRAYSSNSTGPLKRAWRRDAQLPTPLVLFLIIDLLLLVPIPFLLPYAWDTYYQAEAVQVAAVEPPLVAVLPVQKQQQGGTAEAPLTQYWLIDPLQFQAAGGYSSQWIANQLAVLNPDLATEIIEVGAGREQALASVITGQALRWNINPALVLALFETQGAWFSQPLTPTQSVAYALRGPKAGLAAQVSWAVGELRTGLLDFPQPRYLYLADGLPYVVPTGLDQANYALLRFFVRTHTSQEITQILASETGSWRAVSAMLMGTPRQPLRRVIDDTPFLVQPFTSALKLAARFDHNLPLVQEDGVMLAGDTFFELGYDGHNAWDYALDQGTPILAAAAGTVVFSGWIDTGCETPAGVVVLDHANGYQTSYWHVAELTVYAGSTVDQLHLIGRSGSTGCSQAAHLHFGVQRAGRDTDPYGWCRPEPDPWAAHVVGAPSVWLWLDQRDSCALGAQAFIVDETHANWAMPIDLNWNQSSQGNWGSALWHPNVASNLTVFTWRPELALDTSYQVLAFMPARAEHAATVVYRIHSSTGIVDVTIDQAAHAGSWLSLGSYHFMPGQQGYVELRSLPAAQHSEIWVDALAWVQMPE